MISDIVFQVLKSSLFTSLLIGLLLLLVPLLQKRYRAKWRYIAWLVIAVRLLVPFDLSLLQAPIKIEIPEQNTLALVTPPSDERPYLQVDIPSQTDATAISDSVAPPFTPYETAQSSFTITPLVLIGGIWLVGVSVFLLFQAFCYQRFLRKLKTIPTEVIPASIKETIWQIGIDMGICKLPEPVITGIIDAPVLIGVLRPRILLPHTQYTDEALAFILRHELVHYRRRDMLYKLLLLLANAIHWFNPLVYLMTIQAAKDIELACDDDVVRELDRDARGKYGDTILSALPEKGRLEPVFSTRFGSTKKNMKGRLSNLFDMAVKRRGIVALFVLTACALLVTGLVTVGYAAMQPDSIPAIPGGYTFSVPSIEQGKVSCIGKVELGPDMTYKVLLSIESGNGWFVGLHDSPDITAHAGTVWEQEFVMGTNYTFKSETMKTAYLYIGSHSDGGTRLTGISGKVLSPGQPTPMPIPDSYIHARAINGTWAAASSIEGKTWQEQIDNEMKWLDDTYNEHKSSFVIVETLPKSEASNVFSRIDYLYENSSVFRIMSQMKNGLFTVEDGTSFSRFGAAYNPNMMQRTAVMVDNDSEVTIDINYTLTQGKMAVSLVDPDGKTVFQGDLKSTYIGTQTVSGKKGLWSVITTNEGNNDGYMSGNISIALKQSQQTQVLAAPKQPTSTDFSIERLGIHTLKSGDTLEANLQWNGSGYLMLLYTDVDYNNDEILSLMQGLNDVPAPNYNYVGKNKVGSVFNFSQSPTSPLTWNTATPVGSFHFYLIRFGDPGEISGNVSRKNANGSFDGIWAKVGRDDNSNIVSAFPSISTASAAQNTINEVTVLSGSNNITVKSIGAGEVTCIGKIELGPDSAYTASLAVESGSGAMIGLCKSPNITRQDETGWYFNYDPGVNMKFQSDSRETQYVYVGSHADNGTKLTNVTVKIVQTKTPVNHDGNPYFLIKSNGKNVLHSGSYEAQANQTLTLTATSNINGGTVDFFLFSPSNKEQRFTFGGSNKIETVKLSAGTWAYNCTGFFDSGEIVITGTISDAASIGSQSSQANTDTAKYDAEAIRIMDNSGTWGDSINRLLPSMSPSGVKKVVDIYLERHLFSGITTSQAAKQVASTIEPALKYMTKKDQESANSIISAYY